ncbi:MAG: hypothetical protein ACI90V_010602, partial [Bacillariaceae sp.]
ERGNLHNSDILPAEEEVRYIELARERIISNMAETMIKIVPPPPLIQRRNQRKRKSTTKRGSRRRKRKWWREQ